MSSTVLSSESSTKKSKLNSLKSSIKSLTSMIDIDSIHIILILILVSSNLYYYALFINRNIDYNSQDQVEKLKKSIGIINIFVGMFIVGIIIIKLIQEKIETKNAKLLSTIIISLLGLVPVVIYLIQIVNSFQDKNDAYNLLLRCRNLTS